jgi:AcrR family transcriptional regulator
MKKKKTTTRRSYHHGNLRAALLAVARRLVVERGPQGFSLVEAATIAGVSPAAPYRHFASREDLLAQMALEGHENFIACLEKAWNDGQPDVLNAFLRMGLAYLDFAQNDRASYIAMFEAGLNGSETEGLAAAGEKSFALLTTAAAALGGKGPDGKPLAPEKIGAHIWALAHGVASLFYLSGPARKLPKGSDPREIFVSGAAIYLHGLGIDISALQPIGGDEK